MMILAALILGYGTTDCIGNPPPRFRNNATVVVHFTSPYQIQKECGIGALACEYNHQIWIRNPCATKEANDLSTVASDMCHELGHVNGWPVTHPSR